MDFAISASEVTAYGAAWKSGKEWPTPPNPIPVSYLTKADIKQVRAVCIK